MFFTFFIDLSCHDAFAAEISHGLMKPANPSKQINESKSRFGWCIFTGSLIFWLFCIFWDIPSIAPSYGTLNSTFLAKHCNPSYRNAPLRAISFVVKSILSTRLISIHTYNSTGLLYSLILSVRKAGLTSHLVQSPQYPQYHNPVPHKSSQVSP